MKPRVPFEFMIVGAGIAGLATAYHLVRKGVRSLLVVEREELPAAHASGRNAGIFRALDSERWNAELAARSLRTLRAEPWAAGTVRAGGVLLLAGKDQAGRLDSMRDAAAPAGVRTEALTARQAAERVPVLDAERDAAALLSPDDGTVDVGGLCNGLYREIRTAGAEVRFRCEVAGLLRAGGRVTGARTSEGEEIGARVVVNAAGAWAGRLGEAEGATRIPLRVTRRHLVSLEPAQAADPSWPVVWDVAAPAYFRPESQGLLASPCDQVDCDPGEPPIDEAALLDLSRSLARIAPPLAEARVRSAWTCNRTLTPDDLFVLGADPALPGLFWLAGLGGHGMSTGMEAGRLAAEALTGNPPAELRVFSPERFPGPGWSR